MAKSKTQKSKKADKPGKAAKPAKADKAKDELKAAKATIKKLRATIDKLEKSAEKAAKKAKAQAKTPTVKGTTLAPKPAVPNLSTKTPNTADPRTVVQLRAEARAKGIAGYSSMRKDQLVAALKD